MAHCLSGRSLHPAISCSLVLLLSILAFALFVHIVISKSKCAFFFFPRTACHVDIYSRDSSLSLLQPWQPILTSLSVFTRTVTTNMIWKHAFIIIYVGLGAGSGVFCWLDYVAVSTLFQRKRSLKHKMSLT